MPAYSYIVDNDWDLWVFVGTKANGTAVYDPGFALTAVDAGDVPGVLDDNEHRFTEDNIWASHGVRSHGPEIVPAHVLPPTDWAHHKPFVNVP